VATIATAKRPDLSGLLEFARSNNHAVLITVRRDGRPISSPVLNSRNPPDEGPLRIGEVTYQREEEDGFFRFLWRPILNGMRTSAGM
jgi:hypothetical protein